MPDYPSNISRAQFALIQPDLENFRKHTRPRRYDLYDVFRTDVDIGEEFEDDDTAVDTDPAHYLSRDGFYL